jgi:hypothetical protein
MGGKYNLANIINRNQIKEDQYACLIWVVALIFFTLALSKIPSLVNALSKRAL